jgi:polysaccharide deacetylase family protein (PEP-CTERM system associated)
VDVEEYFQVSAFEGVVPMAKWPAFESRVNASLDVLLELMARNNARGTFFVLGWLAERKPALVRAIVDAGHEVASHGWDHKRLTGLNPASLRSSVRESRQLLEDLTGTEVLGFRAPSFSLVPGGEWAFDVLLEEGYRYDASIFPIARTGYGYQNGPTRPCWIRRPSGWIAEFPSTVLPFAGWNVPAAGGAYFRLLPYALSKAALRSSGRRGGEGMFYVHPWELDAGQPRMPVSWRTVVRHYGRISSMPTRIERLLRDFPFRRTVAETMQSFTAPPVPVAAT